MPYISLESGKLIAEHKKDWFNAKWLIILLLNPWGVYIGLTLIKHY